MKRTFGFTLTEMLFVVLIAAGILVFAVPSYKRAKERSAYEAATGLLVKLGSAVQTFEKDLQLKGFYQTAAGGTGGQIRNRIPFLAAVNADTAGYMFHHIFHRPFQRSRKQAGIHHYQAH